PAMPFSHLVNEHALKGCQDPDALFRREPIQARVPKSIEQSFDIPWSAAVGSATLTQEGPNLPEARKDLLKGSPAGSSDLRAALGPVSFQIQTVLRLQALKDN